MDGAVAGSVLGSTGNYTRGGSVSGSERLNLEQPEEAGSSDASSFANDSTAGKPAG